MKAKKFSIKDITVINPKDKFADDKLIKILGGNEVLDCTCKCKLGNCYGDSEVPVLQ